MLGETHEGTASALREVVLHGFPAATSKLPQPSSSPRAYHEGTAGKVVTKSPPAATSIALFGARHKPYTAGRTKVSCSAGPPHPCLKHMEKSSPPHPYLKHIETSSQPHPHLKHMEKSSSPHPYLKHMEKSSSSMPHDARMLLNSPGANWRMCSGGGVDSSVSGVPARLGVDASDSGVDGWASPGVLQRRATAKANEAAGTPQAPTGHTRPRAQRSRPHTSGVL